MQCKHVIVENAMPKASKPKQETLIETFSKQEKDTRLLTYKLMVDKFNNKYSILSESQKQLLNQYITNVHDTETFKSYINTVIPTLKQHLSKHASKITEQVTKIKVQRLSEMLCNVENMNRIDETHVVSLMRYMDLIDELNGVHK
jgi:hypothetical protein